MWLVVINPTSGNGRGADVAKYLLGFLNQRGVKYETLTAPSASLLSQRLNSLLDSRSDIQGVLSVGGDGLAHLVLQSCVPRKVPFSVIPAGTGNDFLRTCGWGLESIDRQVLNVLESDPQKIDLGLVDGEWFGAILSTGFDSIVNERANKLNWPKGPSRYNVAIAMELPGFRPRDYAITIDSQVINTEAMLIAIANGKSYGGGMNIAPHADLSDGLFDILILRPVSKYEFLKVFPKVYSGQHLAHPAVEMHRGVKVELHADAVAYADGERVGSLPVKAECISGAGLTWIA